jgi:hypothetical protein
MAIKQIVPIQITLLGDGAATAFTYALANLYQAGVGGSIPFGTSGVVPSSVSVNNPPIAVTSATVDANGNITITFTTAPTNGAQYTLEVDLIYNSGAATSSSSVQSMNVNVTGGTITATESFAGLTGSAVPSSAAFIAGKNAGNLIGIAVDSSGNVGVQGTVTVAQPTAASLNATVVGTGTFAVQATLAAETTKVIGVVRNADGSGNLLTSTASALDVNLKTSAASITVAQPTAASLNATVIGTGTFAVQASQSGNWTARIVGNTGAIVDGAQNAAAPANALVVAGVFNTVAPTITSGNLTALQTDASGFLKVNVAAGSSGNGAASATGSAVPAQADYAGVNVAGTLRGWTAINPSGSVYAGQIDLSSIAGSTTSTAATGVLKVGIVGSAGAIFDAAQNATAPANVLAAGGVYNSSAPTITTGSLTQLQTDVNANLKVIEKKDAGRTYIVWTIDAATLVTTEALISTAVNKGGTLQGAATTYTVTSGKTLRIQSVSASVQGTNSTVQYAKVRVRSGASVTASSPAVANLFVSNTGASNSIGYAEQNVPDGLEIASGQQIGVSQLGGTVNGNVTVTVIGYEY